MGVKGLKMHVLILQMHSHGQCDTCDLIHISTHLTYTGSWSLEITLKSLQLKLVI